jgi:hypothetical protein
MMTPPENTPSNVADATNIGTIKGPMARVEIGGLTATVLRKTN